MCCRIVFTYHAHVSHNSAIALPLNPKPLTQSSSTQILAGAAKPSLFCLARPAQSLCRLRGLGMSRYYRGLSNYQYYFFGRGLYYSFSIMGPKPYSNHQGSYIKPLTADCAAHSFNAPLANIGRDAQMCCRVHVCL